MARSYLDRIFTLGQISSIQNSAIGLDGAIAHELQHYHRWRDMLVLTDPALGHLDEALTSLQAISRYQSRLKLDEIHKLVADAIQRISLHLATL
jgi:hypothetical protein